MSWSKNRLWSEGLTNILLLLLQMKNCGQKMRMIHALDMYVIYVVEDVLALVTWGDMWEFIPERDLMVAVIVEDLSRWNNIWSVIMLKFTWKIWCVRHVNCVRLFICALWSPAGKGLTSWLSFVVSYCEFVTFPLVSWVRCGTVKPVLSGHSKWRPKIGFQNRLSLNAGQKYCRMLSMSILQYFGPPLSYHLSLRPFFCLFLSGTWLYQSITYCNAKFVCDMYIKVHLKV